ncbi:tumor necrosis factor alpha-induced protein 2-like isoform X1 [Conger conger]|uniref:tumor necrosis factor alpha-induced protein 2-like isoform X1 n=2 Tax=Conger conger TaxID=82655 RepID=UPI002A59F55D|nr:tumor necrosis factor alpha-induced protein 2-like isoform X1 [Conger conger]
MKFWRRFLLCSSQRNTEGRMRTDGTGKRDNFLKSLFRRNQKNPKGTTNGAGVKIDIPPTFGLTFEENLQQGHLFQAGKQLIQQEEHLFGREIGKEEKESGENKEKLKRDYESLLKKVWLSVDSSLSAGAEELEGLKSAVSCIQQEEEQDRRWGKKPETQAPEWRPRQCRQMHDARLEKMVEKRMEEPNVIVEGNMSSLKRDICKMGKQMKEDLLKVARELQNCYPEEFDICSVYAGLYHQAFSQRLTEIADYELVVDDCIYLLTWVNNYYPNDILKSKELKGKINCKSLGDLLPVAVARVLEEQYLSDQETQVKKFVSTALRKQEEAWLSGAQPELIEGHYSPISIDVIQCVDSAMKHARNVLGEVDKAQPIMCQLTDFLRSYKKSLEDFLKGKHGNTKAVIKANLASLEQFETYIVTERDVFTEEMRTCCLSLVNAMKDCGYQYLSKIIHADMKVWYRKLGTQSWLTENSIVMNGLLEALMGHIEKCSDLKTSCFEEFVGRLHGDVMVEYVYRLLKKKLRLKDQGQQEAAARLLCEDSKALHALFTEKGSKEEWLSEILPNIAEVLKTQDPSMIQLDIVNLAQYCPDLSDCHISDLLHLKTNLPISDIKMIKESLSEIRNSVISQNTRPFFSRVHRQDRGMIFAKMVKW